MLINTPPPVDSHITFVMVLELSPFANMTTINKGVVMRKTPSCWRETRGRTSPDHRVECTRWTHWMAHRQCRADQGGQHTERLHIPTLDCGQDIGKTFILRERSHGRLWASGRDTTYGKLLQHTLAHSSGARFARSLFAASLGITNTMHDEWEHDLTDNLREIVVSSRYAPYYNPHGAACLRSAKLTGVWVRILNNLECSTAIHRLRASCTRLTCA